MPGVFDPTPFTPGTLPDVTPEPLTSAGDDLYRRMGPLLEADPANGYALQTFIHAIAEPAQPIADVIAETDTHRPWEAILDPAIAPVEWLPWLAQVPGVELLPSDTEAQARDRVTQAAGIYEGTDLALRQEVARTLVSGDPNQVVVLYPSRWAITVRTRTSDTPDSAASTAAALRQVPAGSRLTYVVSNEPLIDEGGATRTIDAIGSAGTTIDAITVADWA